MKTYSTKQAATLTGVHFITLQRWVSEGRVSPSMRIKQNGREIWVWTAADMKKIKRYKAAHYWEGRGGSHTRKRGERK
jgi:predicted site-specific integrase-resolvase